MGAKSAQAQAAPPAEAPPEYVEAAPAPMAGPTPEQIEQLKQIGGLRDSGILTEEEFAAQKAQILGA